MPGVVRLHEAGNAAASLLASSDLASTALLLKFVERFVHGIIPSHWQLLRRDARSTRYQSHSPDFRRGHESSSPYRRLELDPSLPED